MTLCIICEWQPATRKNRCHTCYTYWKRHGKDRPEELRVRHAEREMVKRRERARMVLVS